jgi:hypothetical protein
MPAPDDGFDQIINEEWHVNPTPEYNHQGPYGTPVQPVKPGLTKRGKVAIAVASVAVAGTGFIWYQGESAQAAKDAKEAAALQIQMQKLELEKLKEINKATVEQKNEQATEDAARQKFVDACVEADKGLVGKQMGVTYSSVVDDCQGQYEGGTDGSDMAAAGSASDTASTDGGGGVNSAGLLALAAGGGLLVVVAANRGKKANAA